MSYFNLNVHIVFSTKDRRPWIRGQLAQRLPRYIGGIIRELEGRMLAANGPADHIHIATTLSPKLAVADVLRTIKSNSSKWIHREFAKLRTFAWQDGYATFSVSHSLMPRVVKYVERQQQHHEKLTFREELAALLKRHGIEYDARYLP